MALLGSRSLLSAGRKADWDGMDTEQRALLSTARLSVEERLRRGQRLSAQAARLRRGIVRR
jgi:hypothetical protein